MDDVIRATANMTAAPAGIALDLAPLLSPYRRHQHLSLRVEQLPIRARFSKGSNNGDRTWSLSLDDLDGLAYLLPDGMTEPHTLAVRVISHEDDYGATVALLDLPITPGEARPAPPPKPAPMPGPAPNRDDQAELRRLKDELAQATAALAAREAELIEARQAAEQARAEEAKRAEAELAAARANWEAELQDRLAAAAAETASTLEKSQAAWQAEQQDRVAASEQQARERVEQAHAHWHQASEAALAKAEESWKTEEAARFAAAEAQWRERSESALAETTARLERAEAALAEARARTEDDGAERRRLMDALDEATASLAARDAALEEAQRSVEHIRADASRQIEAELAAARAAWEAELQTHLAAAEAQWRERSETALSEATARLDRAEAALTEARAVADGINAERHRLEHELGQAMLSLATREAELADAQRMIERLQSQDARQAIDTALRTARTAWEAELQDRLAEAAAEAASALEKSRAAWQAEQQDRSAAWEADIEARIEEARLRWEDEAEAALAKVEDSWKAEEAKRLAAAEAQWREQSESVLTKATARLDRAETALAEACAQIDEDENELRRLKEELAELKTALAVREAEPEPAPLAAEPAPPAWRAEIEDAPRKPLDIGKIPQVQRLLAPRLEAQKETISASSEERATLAPQARGRSRIGLGLALGGGALAAAALAVMFYLRSDLMLFDRWSPTEGQQTAEASPRPIDASLQRPEPTHMAARRIVIGAVTANLRVGPSSTATVIAALPQETEVSPIERRGNWVLIRVVGSDGARRNEGWVYGSSLKEESGGS